MKCLIFKNIKLSWSSQSEICYDDDERCSGENTKKKGSLQRGSLTLLCFDTWKTIPFSSSSTCDDHHLFFFPEKELTCLLDNFIWSFSLYYYQSSVLFSIVQGGRNGSSSHIFDFVVSLLSSWMRVHVERKSVRGQLAHHFDHHHRHHIMIDPF